MSTCPLAQTNLALGKVVTMDTTYSSFVGGNVVDGDINTFSHTLNGQTNHWLIVDLGEDMTFSDVNIVNR
eukprot:Awhi_evm1s377